MNSNPQKQQYPVPRIRIDQNNLVFVDEKTTASANPVWDALWQAECPVYIPVACAPNLSRVDNLKKQCHIDLDDEQFRTEHWTLRWREWLVENLYGNAGYMQMPGDFCPALDVPGFVHGQSQGIADLFGARVEALPDGNFHVHPLAPDPKALMDMTVRPIRTSQYYIAVEYIRYARGATGGALPFRNPVMTGPFDTANYLLGTTTLLEWVYSEPEALHCLLNRITDVLIDMISALRDAAGGVINPHHPRCMRGGFDLCSEVRSLVSESIYREFEAPYLRRIGQSLGAFGAHSCGNWERTVECIVDDPNFRVMNGQIKENDLASLCRLAGGRLTLSIGRSIDVHDEFMWPDTQSYYEHILTNTPEGQPLELTIETEEDIAVWDRLYRKIRGEEYPWTPPIFGE